MTLDDFDDRVKAIVQDLNGYGEVVPPPCRFRSDEYDADYDQGPYSDYVWQQPPFLDVRIDFDYDLGKDRFWLSAQDNEGFVLNHKSVTFPAYEFRRSLELVFCVGDSRTLDRSNWRFLQ